MLQLHLQLQLHYCWGFFLRIPPKQILTIEENAMLTMDVVACLPMHYILFLVRKGRMTYNIIKHGKIL